MQVTYLVIARWHVTQQTQDVETMLVQRWSNVVDGGAALNQHCFNLLCLLGYAYYIFKTLSTKFEQHYSSQ